MKYSTQERKNEIDFITDAYDGGREDIVNVDYRRGMKSEARCLCVGVFE